MTERVGEAAFDLDPADPAAALALHRLRRECVLAKEALSRETETSIPVILPGTNAVVRLTRSELEDAVRPELQQTVAAFRRTLVSAGVTPEDLSAVLVAGGASRMPLVRELLAADLGRPLAGDAHPKYVVALGAAMRALPGAAPRPAGAAGAQAPPDDGWPADVVPRAGAVPQPGTPLPTVTVESVESIRPDLRARPAGVPRRASPPGTGRAAAPGACPHRPGRRRGRARRPRAAARAWSASAGRRTARSRSPAPAAARPASTGSCW